MQLDEERLEGVRTTLMGNESDGYSFFETGKKEKEGSWYVSNTGLGKFGPQNEKGDADYDRIDADRLLKESKGKELTAGVFLGYVDGEEKNAYYIDWAEFAKAIGVSPMVALAVKVPGNIAKRFKVFANEDSTPADVMRKLICDYVSQYMKDNADSLRFRESV